MFVTFLWIKLISAIQVYIITKNFTNQDLVYSFNLLDIWRNLYSFARQYAYFFPFHLVYSKIDYLLCFKFLFQFCQSADISSCLLSDHSWVPCYFSQQNSDKNGLMWSLNWSVLKDDTTKSIISQEITHYFEANSNCSVTPLIVWDALKAVIQGHFISLTSFYKKRERTYYYRTEV